MKSKFRILIVSIFALTLMYACTGKPTAPKSSSGVTKATADIEVGSDGYTVEQRNIKKRLETDNEIGAIKHLYIISAMSGQVIMYSTVDGKVTSGGKRLTPKTLGKDGDSYSSNSAMKVDIGGDEYYTQEVIQDDGTYGTSMNYLYWWDVKGVYHQHYVNGGQIVHISSEAMPVSDITINLSL